MVNARLLKKRARLKRFFNMLRVRKKLNDPKFTHLYVGSPFHGNLGDQQIRNSSLEFLTKKGINYIEVSCSEYYVLRSDFDLKHKLRNITTICLHGGGNLGDVYREEILLRDDVIRTFKDKKIIVFPETYYREDNSPASEALISNQIFAKHDNLVIAAREKFSYEVMKKEISGAKIILTPDIVLSSDYTSRYKKQSRGGCSLLCVMTEKSLFWSQP